MATTNRNIITTDKEAIVLLRRVLETQSNNFGELEFSGWPTVTVRFTGSHYDGTITSGTAQALIEYQRAVEHAYIRLVRPGTKRLSAEEKRQLAVTAKVEKGSTVFTLDLNDALTQIATQLVGKMSPNDIIITILGLGTIAGATFVAKAFLKERSAKLVKDKELDSQVALSAQETKRLEVLAQAMKRQPNLIYAQAEFDDARDDMLRAGSDAKTIEFEGIKLTAAQAGALVRQQRAKSVEAQLNGVYTIIGVFWNEDEEVILDIRTADKTREFKASLNTQSLLPKDRDLIAKAEWDRTPLYLSINAKILRDVVVSANIVGFDWEKLRKTV